MFLVLQQGSKFIKVIHFCNIKWAHSFSGPLEKKKKKINTDGHMRADSFKDGYAILQNFWRKMSILVFSTSDKNQNYKKK